MRWARLVSLQLVLSSVAVLSCPARQESGSRDTRTTQGAPADRQVVAATIGKDKITVGMLMEELSRQDPFLRRSFASPERRRAFLKSYVKYEVLAREAQRLGLDRDPEVVWRVKQVMIDRLMETKRSSLVKIEEITDRDIEEYYNKNKHLYQRPAKVRASQIVVPTRRQALEVLRLAGKKPKDIRNFSDLVERYSTEPVTKAKRGDLDFFGQDDSDRVARPVIQAVFALHELWSVGGPVKTDQGWVVVMKTGEMAAVNRPLSTERNRIKNQLFNDRRLQALEKFVAGLQVKAKVKIYEENLDKVKVDPVRADPKRLLPKRHRH